MASKSLSFLLFGEDVTAGKAFKKVAADAEASGGRIKGAFSGGSMLAIGGLVAGLGLATKGAANFQTQMVRLVTAAGESQANLNMVSKGVMSISSSTGTSLKATGDAMYYIESAGFHGAAGLTVLKAAAQGAKVEGADTKVVADALTTALTDLGKSAGPPAKVMSELVATVSHGKMTMDDLAGSLHSVLPNAAALHISFTQVAGAIATMTAQGISADQATQNLNHTILSLANPTAVQTKAMAAFGINASTLAKNLGQNGLTGTLQILTDSITKHMGPAGLTITNALNSSQIAAGKVTEGYKVLAPAAKTYFDALVSGGAISKSTIDGTKGLTLAQDAQLKQLVVLYKRANGFSDLLKSSNPDALTYTAALAKMTGGMTGLQVATHLTGDNMATFKANVAAIGKSTSDASGNVVDFAVKQETLNQKLDTLKVTASNLGVELGTKLIPAVSAAADWTLKHQTAVISLIGGLVGLKVALVGYRLAMETVTAVQGVAAAAMKLFGGTAASTAATVSAAAAEETAATEAAAAKQTSLLAWTGESYVGLGAAATTSAATQTAANDTAAASMGRMKMSAGGAAMGIAALGLVVYEAGKKISDYTERNNAAAKTMDGLGGQTTDLTTALVNNGGVLDDNVKSIVQAEIAHTGLSDKAAKAGITTAQLTQAVTGSKDALGLLIQQWRASGKPSQDTIGSLELQWVAYHKAAQGAATAAANTHAFASALSTIPKNIHTSVTVSASAGNAFSVIREVVDYANNQTAVIHVTATNPITGGTMGGRQAFASGTDYVSQSGMYTVGEQGRERVFLPKGAQVQNASATRAAGGSGGDTYVTVNVTQPLGTPDQIARAVLPAIAHATKNGQRMYVAGRQVN